ncbi:MAG: hypothetical protein H8D45_11855 [Bacteroidetes bacterium]|nr:hypothetical protein [Bacteroidota bacterium]
MIIKFKKLNVIKAIFNEIIPEDGINGKIGAGTLIDNSSDILKKNNFLNNFVFDVFNQLKAKSISSNKSFELHIINALNNLKKNDLKGYNSIIFLVFELYYSNSQILENIGKQPVPPFPTGRLIEDSDLLLFEDVYLRGKIFRD